MELSPYLETLGRDLAAAAATGGPDVVRAADLLAGALDASARLCLLEALSDAAAEITTKLDSASVELRLRGREADLVVTSAAEPAPAPAPPPATGDGGGGELTRITLRLPEWLKQEVERAAAVSGGSVNAWLVDAITAAIKAGGSTKAAPYPKPGSKPGRRFTGFAQA